jgi:hypothetical protein
MKYPVLLYTTLLSAFLLVPFAIQVLVYLPFVAFARFLGRPTIGGSATTTISSWRALVIIAAIILALVHTAQRLRGGGSQFLFVEGDSVISLTLYVSLVLLALCAVAIATDLTTRVYSTKLHDARSQRAVP